MDVTILWFKRDLRLADHAALALAASGEGAVLPLYIVEPDYWRQPDVSARQWRFTAESLRDLSAALSGLGASLQVVVGDAVQVFDALAGSLPVARLVSHEETGNGWTYARDRRVAAWARGCGLRWEEVPQSGVVRRLQGRDGWAAARDRRMRAPPVPPPAALRGLPGMLPGAIPEARDLGLGFDPCPGRQKGGRAEGLGLLETFLDVRGQDYRRAMASPLSGATACSRLSPHLALGTLSAREVEQAAARRRTEARGTRDGWAGSLGSFASRLAWRDHFMQKLEDEPRLESLCLHPAYEGLRPRDPDPARLAAWARGETGLPFVDACMRSLIATGWLNFRMRAMLVSVASHHLWLDWRATGAHLARMFTDYEPGIHWPQMQMQAGTTGINTIRIYNPVKQGQEQDPEGVFTREWLPELAAVPDAFLQEPWRWEGAGRLLGRRYPAPIVDVTAAGRAARMAVWAVRARVGFHDEAALIVERHASRKDRAGRFVNDRAPRLRGDARQLSLDL
ncbi:cryptochrome/deoxyribodipyrimidine photo-lyase family protein [Rhodovulum steppense]|uniref:Deoxyribodipyrimidine photo-lyase family protein (Cryptochrome) n=1 Tax=Rhodovulum steppense TaxID=540251 RepID=A0A4R1YXX6_9RHOB|nr:cryptochrome/deoxyribodipyrimidine photo-lyase family protein [Rhodovulum steppense]TCM86101.1 deoxyribodipyrimidine photo-lyase family protein (cryptochrome) [Rhodovulum steppense]